MDKRIMIPVDELAAFMNDGWPGVDWYLSDHAEYLWEKTFTEGHGPALYRPRRPGALINLFDYEAQVRWQGNGVDPTHGQGTRLSTMFLRWQRTRTDAMIVAYVPREKLSAVTTSLKKSGGLLVYTP